MRSPFLQTVYFDYYVRLSAVDEIKIQAHNTAEAKKKMCTTLVFPLVILVSITFRRGDRVIVAAGKVD